MEIPKRLKVGVVQLAQVPTPEEGQAKFARFMREAKSRGCRVVVFQEGALHCPADASRARIDAAVQAIRQAAAESGIYVVAGTLNKLTDEDPLYNRLYVIAPSGAIIHSYDKLWGDPRFPDVPGTFMIDGVPCCAIICADRWIRGVEELPVFAGAKIIFECSNNYDNEWIPDLGWYWYVPRALRNGAYVVFCNGPRDRLTHLDPWPGHGHSAVIAPDGAMLAAAGDENDRLLVAELDLARATRAEAERRHSHPLFRRFWDTGVQIMHGAVVEAPPFAPLASSEVPIALAAAQMACARSVEDNLARMRQMLQEARARGAQVVAFPALAITGARDDDICAARPEALAGALREVQAMALALRLYVAFGMPHVHPDGRRTNAAFVVGPDGALLTRYDQLVVDRPDLFSPGLSSKVMWFDVLGVPAVVTVGRDALWSELAELAAVRGRRCTCTSLTIRIRGRRPHCCAASSGRTWPPFAPSPPPSMRLRRERGRGRVPRPAVGASSGRTCTGRTLAWRAATCLTRRCAWPRRGRASSCCAPRRECDPSTASLQL
mgnify:CR=1 FL=1